MNSTTSPSDDPSGSTVAVPRYGASRRTSVDKSSRNFWITCLSYTAALVAAIALLVRLTSPSDSTAQVVFGLGIGLAMFLTVIAGLAGRCWLGGIWRTTGICTIAALVIVLAESSRYTDWETSLKRLIDTSFSFFVIPLAILAMAGPLLVMRVVFGWQFRERGKVTDEKSSIGLDQLLLVVSSIAAMMFMTKVPQTVWNLPANAFWLGVLPVMGFLSGLSLLTTVPSVWFMFHFSRRRLGWLFALIQVMLAVALIFQVTTWFQPSTRSYLFTPITAAVVFTIGLFIIRLSGFELSKYRVKPLATASADVETPEFAVDRNDRVLGLAPKRNHLIWTAITLFVAAISSVSLAAYESSQLKVDSSMSQLAAQLQADGGELVCHQRQPWRIVVGNSATDETVRQLSSYRSLKELSLAGSQITNATLVELPKWFPELQRLDLGHTNISPQGLLNIRELKMLRNLGLAGTTLTTAEINRAIQPLSTVGLGQSRTGSVLVDQLDLSDTSFTAQDILQLDAVVRTLAIRNLNFNDQDIAKVCQRTWTKLDISGNSISGSGLNYQKLGSLIARDVPLTDRNVAGLSISTMSSLDIDNTRLTDNALASFASLQTLVIGEGQITDAGILKAMGNRWIQNLKIHGKGMTCEFLLKIQQMPYWLDLSRSGITDNVLTRVGSTWNSATDINTSLNLAETNISDFGIQGLNGCSIRNLDIRGTKVTAQAIIDLGLLNNQGIYVDFNQFTSEELKAMRKHRTIFVGEVFPRSPLD